MTKVLINSAAIRKKDLVVVDGDLNVVENAKISVVNKETGAYALIYEPDDQEIILNNPFSADETGQFAFWVEQGIYKVSAVTELDTLDLEGSVTIDVRRSKSNVGFISEYIAKYGDFKIALEQCCLENYIVDFEGLTLETDETPEIPAESLCRHWRVNEANLKFTTGELKFYNKMDSITNGGQIHLGLKLAKIAENGTFDATTIKVYNSVPGIYDSLEFVVGDYVASSLDNNYLPNSPNRVGYVEYGDFNRIKSITDNGDGTSTITVTYPFLRSSDPNVYSGLLQNAWIGNPSFQIRGIQFIGNTEGHLLIDGTVITNPRGYALDIDNGAGALRKATATYNMLVQNTFIDIIRHRAYGLELGPQYRATRQYDFGKQHLVLNMPKEGYVTYRSGCRIERQNKDGEVFYTPFSAGETTVERGKVTVEAGCYFDGAQPSDLPTSDFGPGGQVYWGLLVSITDAQHFEVPNAANCVTGGMYFAGRAVNYSRCITGTSFAAKDSYEAGTIVFDGAEIECEPAFISIKGGQTTSQRFERYRVNTINCTIYSRGLNNYDGGCYHIDTGSNIIMTEEARTSPQLNGSQSFNFVNKTGGMMDGRYSIAGSDTVLRLVNIAYQGTNKPERIMIFNSGFVSNNEDVNLLLMSPRDNIFEGSGTIADYESTLPITAWFGSNATSFRASPPDVKFKILGTEFPSLFNFGSKAGFSKRYTQVINATVTDGKPNPLVTGGIWSASLDNDDIVFSKVDDRKWLAKSYFQTLLSSSAAYLDPTVTVNTAPTNSPTHVGIYSSLTKTWFWYNIESIVGTTVTLGSSYISTSGVAIGAGHNKDDRVSFVRLEEDAPTSSAGDFYGARIEGYSQLYNSGGLLQDITFSTEIYDDSGGGFWVPSASNQRLYVEPGITRVNISGYIEFPNNGVLAGEPFRLRVRHYNSAGGLIGVVAAFDAATGYRSQRCTTGEIGIPVSSGDYFTLAWSQEATGTILAFTKAVFTIQKVK